MRLLPFLLAAAVRAQNTSAPSPVPTTPAPTPADKQVEDLTTMEGDKFTLWDEDTNDCYRIKIMAQVRKSGNTGAARRRATDLDGQFCLIRQPRRASREPRPRRASRES